MADILCGYTADRDETLVAYLYGDIDPAQRAAFDAHIATCERCRLELAELRDVRGRLESWETPAIGSLAQLPVAAFTEAPLFMAATRERPDRWRALREVPAWAQVAAAVLVLGVSAGLAGAIAHLDVRYGQEGLTVRTGWSRPETTTVAAPAAIKPGAALVPAASAPTPWTSDLDALERRLRTVIRESSAAAVASAATATAVRSDAAVASDAELLRKVKALLDDSERKQRNELGLRIAEVVEEFDAKRGNDLANIRNMKTMQTATGVEVARQQQVINYYLMRTSMQK